MLRTLIFLVVLWSSFGQLRAQVADVVITGELLDANTGDTLYFGHVEVVGVNGYAVNSERNFGIYKSMDVSLNAGVDQMLFFNANGYQTRMAEFEIWQPASRRIQPHRSSKST